MNVTPIEGAFMRLTRKPAAAPDLGKEDDWRDHAVCREYSPDMWFPEPHSPTDSIEARRICRELCPVKNECLTWALMQPEALAGIWGGTTERERRGVRGQASRRTGRHISTEERILEVRRLDRCGYTTAQISEQLGISQRTAARLLKGIA